MSILHIESLYLYPLENSKQHKTERFELVHDNENPVPILRRGITFTIAVRFENRGYDSSTDSIKFIFNFGEKPNPIKGTKGVVKLNESVQRFEDGKHWSVKLLNVQEKTITLEALSPPDCPVGIWNIQIETSVQNSTATLNFNYENDVYILFNPWNCSKVQGDLVYMPEERLLDEYVLNDVGKVWVGPWGSSKGREWVFGQFDACVLPAAMLMFERSELLPSSRGDPISVTRAISKMVNSNDDDGILVGRWDGEYEDGTAPAAWTGSVDILQQFLDTGMPVSYGQCWVFSGVVTTICRALGIPSRVVSNLVSAHDANATLTVDKYYNADNEEMENDPFNEAGVDSIWNYHVWNDVWMARPDLPKGYGGWQAIDATPQETSLAAGEKDAYYQCGPASLEAIKKGAVGFNYDVAFMVASVNADLMRWKEDPNGVLGYTKIYCNKYHIGRLILTKKPFLFDPNGDKDREDITDQYKAKEGTEAERLSLYNAVRGTHLAKSFYSMPDPKMEDIEFELEELERIKIGESFNVTVNIKNKCEHVRRIKAVLSAGSVFYTGIKAKSIKKAQGEFIMKPHTTEQLMMKVTADDYLDKLVEYCILKLYAVASVTETNQTWADEDDFQVLKPKIDIRIDSEVPANVPTQVTLRFVNPLKKILTNCKFNIAGPGLARSIVLQHSDVKPNGLVKTTVEIVPKIVGEQKLIATFTSSELLDITGSAKVEVYEE